MKTQSNFIVVCQYCNEELLEDEMVIYDDKPFHKNCVKNYKEMGRV